MSYNCTISFKQIDSKNVYDFLLDLKTCLMDNMESISKDNYMFAPSVRYFNKPYSDFNTYAERESYYGWVKSIFTFRYVYFKNIGLLAIYSIPNCVQHLFDDTIYFQNSTDQDYDFRTWDKIEVFKNIAYKWEHCSDDYVINTLGLEKGDDIDYHRKSGCYSEIWETYLSDTLFNEDSVIYFSCFGYYDLLHIQKFLDYCDNYAIEKGFIDC